MNYSSYHIKRTTTSRYDESWSRESMRSLFDLVSKKCTCDATTKSSSLHAKLLETKKENTSLILNSTNWFEIMQRSFPTLASKSHTIVNGNNNEICKECDEIAVLKQVHSHSSAVLNQEEQIHSISPSSTMSNRLVNHVSTSILRITV